MNICLIPARGGSKRIPYKNIKEFKGQPIINYAIQTAIKSELFDEIVVSTDDELIKKELDIFKSKVIIFDRSKETATDDAMLADVILEFMDKGYVYKQDILCCLLPCTPLLDQKHLQDAYRLYNNSVDSVVPVVQYSQPYQRALRCSGNNKVRMLNEDYYNIKSQDLLPVYYDPGAFWILNPTSFKEYKKLYMPMSVPFEMSELETQDIDTPEDWKMLELKYMRKYG